ncbi:MAG: S41 family peptidase [Terriglobia bacterium]
MSARVRTAAVGISLLVVSYVLLGGLLGRTASEGAYRQLGVFSEVLTRIQSEYVEKPDLHRVATGALRGLLESLDPYSGYLSPREYAEYREKKQNPEGGEVGLVLSKRFGLIQVVSVLPESPAARAGLGTRDILESLAGFSTREMSVQQAYVLLGGAPGTSVKVAVVRAARAEPKSVDLVRARLEPTRAFSGRLEEDIGYLKIASFSRGKAEEVAAALRQLRAQGAGKLVIDLRDCAAGNIPEAVETARLLLPRGIITYVEGQQYPREQFNAEPDKVLWSGPVTVLINNGTAGAAEILAAAVLENGRGEVIGQRSYGVSSVQELIPLDDGSALILSVAKYYSPAGKAIQDNAVTPSVEVEPGEQASGESPPPRPQALPPPGDPVLLKALELLRAQPASETVGKAA